MTALVVQLITVTTGIGAVTTLLWLRRGLLQTRDAARRCPSCGRLIDGRACRACRGRAR
jgi:hypothetical protein